MLKTQLLEKKVIRSFLTKKQLDNLSPKKLFVIAVIDEKGSYQGYRQLSDKIPSNWGLMKFGNNLSIIPVVKGG